MGGITFYETINSEQHKITVEFLEPKIDNRLYSDASEVISEKLEYVIDLVMQDLNEELNSVKHILISNQISFFLEIEKEIHKGYVQEQVVTDLVEMVANYDILVHPSASKLLEMILLTIANISGFHLFKHKEPKKFNNKNPLNKSHITRELDIFLSDYH